MKTTPKLRKALKWIGFVFVGLIFIILLIYTYAAINTGRRLHAVYEVDNIDLTIPGDSASISRGAHLVSVYACRDCHGDNFAGKIMMDNPAIGRFTTTNLTRGKGGIPADYSDQDWLRALKHGVNQNGNPLIGMPSNESTQIPDEDLAALIAYCKSLPPVDNELKRIKIGPVMKLLTAFGKIDLLSAEHIDHQIERIAKPEESISVDFGATLAINCIGCHGAGFKGGPSVLPDHPPVPDISSEGRVGKWSEEQFMQTLRTGITPDGHKFDNATMPWTRFGEFSDVELKALRKYLLSFPQPGKSAGLSAK